MDFSYVKRRGAGVLILILFTAAICSASDSSGFVTGSGCSVSNVGYLSDIAKEYERKTGVKVLVRGGGTVVGIEDVREGRVDFAASCRQRTFDDPPDIKFIQVAWDALVFIVHKSNPVDNISLEDVRDIYEGKIRNWQTVGGENLIIKVLISRPQKGLSGVESSTREMVMKGADFKTIKNSLSLPSTGIVEQMVEQTPGGFATTGFSSARKRNLKMLRLGGVAPNKETISKNKYPMKRPLFLILPANPKPEAMKFVNFVLSDEGQRYMSFLGIISLLDVR